MHAAPMLCSPMRLPAPPLSNVPRAIHRELGASRVVGGVAGRWQRRRRPIPTNQASAYACAFCWFASATCDASGARGGFCRRRERTADTTAARPMHAAPMLCLHHPSVTCSGRPATACDRSGARGQSSHRRGGEAMAAAAYPNQPVLCDTCDTPSRTPCCACRCVCLQ